MNKPISQTLSTLMVLVLAIGGPSALQAQVQGEYFFDDDPGRGQATPIEATIAADGNLQFDAPTSGLTPGSHLLGFRAFRHGSHQLVTDGPQEPTTYYGPTMLQSVYVPRPVGEMAIRRVEYFWDVDPGYGQATALSIPPGLEVNLNNVQIPTTGISAGIHQLGLRAYGNGGWGSTLVQDVYIPPTAQGYVTRLEYFWDADPGTGQGTPIAITPGQEVSLDHVAVSTEGLDGGTHTLFLRAYGSNGWGPTVAQDVYVQPTTTMTITRGEYFWNDDPGFGQGTPISLTPGKELAIDDLKVPSYMAHGDATLFVRFLGTQGWSPTIGYTVMVDAEGHYTLNAEAETSMEQRNYQQLTDAFDDFADRGISADITLAVKTKDTDYAIDATEADRQQQLAQISRNLNSVSTARHHTTIALTADEDTGNSVSVATTAEALPTVVELFSQTSRQNVALTINGKAYDFTPASVRSQEVCSGSPTTAVALSAISSAVKATWTARPHSGSLISGFDAEGQGDLPAMTLTNSGTTLDSLAYQVTLTTPTGEQLCQYTYYIFVHALMAKQAFTALQPATNSSLDPVETTLQWNPFNDAVGYHLVVTEADGEAEYTEIVNTETSKTSYTVSVKTGHHYKWTVTAIGHCDELTSGVQTFEGRLLPDLAVTAVNLPEAAEAGNQLTVTATVKNLGPGATKETAWTDRLYYVVSTDDFNQAVEAATQKHEGTLAADGTYDVTFQMTVPYVESGTLKVFVVADADGSVLESNPDNNRTLSATSATLSPFYMNTDDLAALRQLFADFNGMNWNGTRWNTTSELIAGNNWSGVSFDSDGRVTAINLQGRNLTGSLSAAKPLALPCLASLNLSRNALMGDPSAYVSAANMPALTTLDLSYNQIDELTAPLPADVALTLTYQHRTYNKSSVLQGLGAVPTAQLPLSTQMAVSLPAIAGYVHADQTFTAKPTLYVYKQGMGTRYGTLSWSTTNDCYAFASYGSNMLDCQQDEDVLLMPATGALAYSAYPARIHLTSGDANMTGWVDVNDVQATLNNIIQGTTTKFNRWAANTWDDELINIQDIVCTVNIVLENQGEASRAAARRKEHQAGATPSCMFYADGRYICLSTRDSVAAFRLALQGVQSDQVRLLLPQSDWQMLTLDTPQGVSLVVFSPTGQSLPVCHSQLLRLSAPSVQLMTVDATSPLAEPVNAGVCNATGVSTMVATDADTPTYDLQGRRVADEPLRLPQGVYIKNGKKIRR